MKRGTFYFKTYWIPRKAQSGGKGMAGNAFIIKEESLKIKQLNIHHEKLENQQTKKKA